MSVNKGLPEGLFGISPLRQLANLIRSRTLWPPVFLELMVAVSMCAAFYFLMRGSSMALVQGGDNLNYWAFSACTIPNFHLDDMSPVWCGRFFAMISSGFWLDVWDPHHTLKQYGSIFALYHTAWLFLIFLAVILSCRHSLLINFGIFAGLIYYFSPAGGWYFYPWDMPATFFFTLGVIFYERRQMGLMFLAVIIGCYFKETVLVCALLILFFEGWNRKRRVMVFLLMVTLYAVGKRLFLAEWNLRPAVFSMNNANKLTDLLATNILEWNLRFIFNPKLNNILFVNAGTLVAVLSLCWGKLQRPYTMTILAFAGALLMFGAYNEFRVFMQILPPSLMLLSLRWQQFMQQGDNVYGSGIRGPTTALEKQSPWSVRTSSALLKPLAMGIIICLCGLMCWQAWAMVQLRQPAQQIRTFQSLSEQAEHGRVQSQFQLAKRYQMGEGTAVDPDKAVYWYKRAATNMIITAPEIIFAQESLGAIYLGKEDKISAYAWLKLATQSGSEKTPKVFKQFVTSLTPTEISAGELEINKIRDGESQINR